MDNEKLLSTAGTVLLVLAVFALIVFCALSPSPDDEIVVDGEWVQISETEVST